LIVFDLRCLAGGEQFEAWFRSGADFDRQSEQGLIQCPYCQSPRVEKAPMAPLVSRQGPARDMRAAFAQAAELQQKLLKESTWVGEAFPATARAMHLGESEVRPIHGQASADEARSLLEDGVPVLPLPLPIVPPRQVN
jgi:hypothetical protein